MSSVHLGYRRLYDAINCSILNREELRVTFPFGEHSSVQIYMGPKPRFDPVVIQSSKYLILNGPPFLQIQPDNASGTHQPTKFFTEIFYSMEVEVSTELFEAFYKNSPEATQELMSLAESRKEEFQTIIEFVAGIIGLRFHPQFVMEVLSENFILLRDDNLAGINYSSAWIRQLEPIILNENGINEINRIFPAIDTSQKEKIDNAAQILSWLSRAWVKSDNIDKFVSLFIPLEMILEGRSVEEPEQIRNLKALIRELINNHAGDNKKELATFFNGVASQRPSLAARFESLVQEAKLPGWESDIAAFRRFNKIRNALMHRGEAKVNIVLSVSDDEVRSLEDIVERYVSLALFGDTRVYQSIWSNRP